MTLTHFAIIAVCAYLFGSLSFAIIVSKVTLGKDIRNYGSGNAGLTNAYRTMGAKKTLFVLLGDIAKGAAAVSVGWALGGPVGKLTAGIFVILGHMFPLYFGFKGGKGIAVAVGCLFVTFGWVGACLELLIFIVLVVATKRVSIGSIAAALSCPFFSLYYFWGDWIAVALCTLAGLTVVWAHRGNIKRLRDGTESRIGDKKKA